MRLHDVFLNLSQNLTQDENLLSFRERELLGTIWHQANQFASSNGTESKRLETILTYALGENNSGAPRLVGRWAGPGDD